MGGAVQLFQIDLCDNGDGKYVVNYRWGKLDTIYKESSRTVFPVDLPEAQKIFHAVVEEKLAAGYVHSVDGLDSGAAKASAAGEAAPTTPNGPVVVAPMPASDPRAETVLGHLRGAIDGQLPRSGWKLSRVIWRAGELGLAEAVPLLLRLGLKGENFHDYSLLWALARLKSTDAISLFREVFGDAHFPQGEQQRVAAEGLMRTLPEAERLAFAQRLVKRLPAKLQPETTDGTAEQFAVQLAEVCQRHGGLCDFIYAAYLLSEVHPHVLAGMVLFCRQTPLRPNLFKPIRWLFKAAELRCDSELFAVLSYRFETSYHNYSTPYWGDSVYHEGQLIRKASKELQKSDSRLAYSDKTRTAFRRRSARSILRAGDAGSSDYVAMAAALLLQYDDSVDGGRPYSSSYFDYSGGWRNRVEISTHYDTYSGQLAFNHILYANSPRYELAANRLKWKCRAGYQPGQPAPDEREEAFPELWDQVPDTVIHLLAQSRCVRVHEFAVRVFRANMETFAPRVKVADLVGWLARESELTQALALDIAAAQYDPDKPSYELVLALLDCELDRARETALDWVRAQPGKFLPEIMFAAALLTSSYDDVRGATRELLQPDLLSDSAWDIVLARVVSILIQAVGEEGLEARIETVRETLAAVAGPAIGRMPFSVIEDLLRQPDAVYHVLAAQFLHARPDGPATYPAGTLTLLIESASPIARRLGTELFARFTDKELAERQDVVASLCLSQHPEIRDAVQAVVARLAARYPDFGGDLLERYYPLLLRRESTPGLHDDLLRLIRAHLLPFMARVPAGYALRMLRCPYLAGKELGWEVLLQYGGLDALTMRERVELGGNDVQRVRTAVCHWIDGNAARVIEELAEAVRIVDAKWDDTQQFAMDWFRNNVSEAEWSPEILVSLCDSNTPKVQAYGKELITRYFRSEDGPRYLLQLSQHSAANMQIFAVNYLEKYAAGNVVRLAELEGFFVTLLAMIDQGRIAKTRTFAFLQREGEASRESAEIVLRILGRHSATMSVLDKAACIMAMASLQAAHDGLESPLTLLETEVAR
ncbi:hypothetical protein [Cerasicoccus maritimus]|uniref:hypothetical protein n=1 Tax=Cerasicoccus maritimus TaxID=490089 RepID=UPI0028527814|nr:hypothetical protein [Cerasicoccus maritimus]